MNFMEVWKNLGFYDQESYYKWIEYQKEIKYQPTQEDIDLLHPEKIDNASFWEEAEKTFGTAICGQRGLNFITDKNQANKRLALNTGLLNYYNDLVHYYHYKMYVLDIGCGYGWFANMARNDDQLYVCCDLVPRIQGCQPVNVNGIGLNDLLKNEQSFINLVLCSNVFQHLTPTQQLAYIQDSYNILVDNGYFCLGCQGNKENNNKKYLRHFGQYTELFSTEYYGKILQNTGFELMSISTRSDYYLTIIAKKVIYYE